MTLGRRVPPRPEGLAFDAALPPGVYVARLTVHGAASALPFTVAR